MNGRGHESGFMNFRGSPGRVIPDYFGVNPLKRGAPEKAGTSARS